MGTRDGNLWGSRVGHAIIGHWEHMKKILGPKQAFKWLEKLSGGYYRQWKLLKGHLDIKLILSKILWSFRVLQAPRQFKKLPRGFPNRFKRNF